MKYQCTVCGQIIDTNESCPICGSDSSKIMEVGETNNPTMFRCLNCGRVFENAEECPYCQGTELYDLTHDEIYDKNKNKKEEVKEKEDDSLSLFLKEAEETFEDKPVDVSKVETPKEEDIGEPLFEEDDSSLIKDDLFDNSDVLIHEDKKEEKEEIKEVPAPFVNELFEEPVTSVSEEKVEPEEIETQEEPVVEEKEEPIFEETKEVVEEKVESIPVEETKEEHHCEFCEGDDCECEDNEEECSCENKEEHECCCNHEEHNEEEHHECCCGHNEENHECSHHEEEAEEDVCHYDAHDGECCHHQGGCLKEQRDMLRKEILHSLLIKNMDAIKLDESLVNAEDKELFEQLLKETSLLKEESYYSLIELFEAKVETEKEIFKKRPSPLEGHLLFKDSELLEKFKKGE